MARNIKAGSKRKAKQIKFEDEEEIPKPVEQEEVVEEQKIAKEVEEATEEEEEQPKKKKQKKKEEAVYFEDKRNMEDLWKTVFPVGTEWDLIETLYEDAFEEGGLLYGKRVYVFGCTEPQSLSVNGDGKLVCIPVIVAVVNDFPPSDKIGINSVQREAEEIIPMKQMKMNWVPYIPIDKRGNQFERLKKSSDIFIWRCTQRREGEEIDQCTVVDIMFPEEPPVVCYYDWDLDDVNEFVEEKISDQRDAFPKFINDKVKEAKNATKEAKEARKKAKQETSEETKRAFENMRFYKFYPVTTPDTPDVSDVKSRLHK
ncbi:hypothetical protein MKW98_026223 [Papaver atlanticum]|uniref:Uncharacterized protein n=1 Tax=Papaver atlanticum TaxID=357466 RepID=A0AAD4T4F3_9MAGN|nr:hypothetical protein MKW98_026223 [Papaver atlanticum]